MAEMVRRLVEALHPERIYLFGSQARGDATEDSDYDLLVIVPERQDQPVRMEQRAYQALRGLPGAVDVVVMSRDFFERRKQVVASLPATVVREGKLLHGGRAGRGDEGLGSPWHRSTLRRRSGCWRASP